MRAQMSRGFAGGLTDRELEVLCVLWEHGEQKPENIRERYGRPVKSPALRSVLGILVSKGYARRRQKGKAFYYRAVLSRADALRSEARRLAATFADGSIPALVRELKGLGADPARGSRGQR
jgi:predicted transcriptional regulator